MTPGQIVSVVGYLFSPFHYALYPPAHADLPFKAGIKGAVVDTLFQVVETKTYQLKLLLYFSPGNALDQSRVQRLAGIGQYSFPQPGLPDSHRDVAIPLHVSIERLDAGRSRTILDNIFPTQQPEGCGAAYCSKIIVGTKLDPGNYHLRLESLADIAPLADVPTHAELAMWGPK